jgi:hypothetical protein
MDEKREDTEPKPQAQEELSEIALYWDYIKAAVDGEARDGY